MEKLRLHDRIAVPYLATVAVSSSLFQSMKYRSTLEITPSENGRYFRKSRNLAMCYAGFAQDPFSAHQALGAGKAAFLSCVYDVASDWKKGNSVVSAFENLVTHEASPKLADMAIGLLRRDMEENFNMMDLKEVLLQPVSFLK